MLITLAGVTGIGKSYFKEKIVESLGLKRLTTITTRKRRESEKDLIDRLFITEEELDNLINDDKVAYYFSYLGNKYAYLKDEIFSSENSIVELHYSTIYDFKKLGTEICSIYLMPLEIEKAKQVLRERGLSPDVQEMRLKEIDEHYQLITKDIDLRKQFDFVFYNNYDLDSEEKLINLVNSIISDGER